MKFDVTSDINKDYTLIMNYDSVDRFIVRILWGHFAVVLLFALTNAVLQLSLKMPSPFAWRVISGPEATAAILIGLAAAGIPTWFRGRVRPHYLWRVGITVALVTYSYLLVFLSGGSIEMHFHFFMVMALLVVYSDWRLGWIVLVLAGLHHAILNYVAPGWVYFYGRNDLAVLAHGLPVAATAVFTTLLCNNNRRPLAESERRRRAAEALADVGRVLSETLDVDLVGQRITEGVRQVFGVASAGLHRLDPDSGALVAVATSEQTEPPLPWHAPPHAGTDVAGLAVKRGAAVATPDALTDPDVSLPADIRQTLATTTSLCAVLAVPLHLKGRMIGALTLIDHAGRVFPEAERRMAELFADQAALALENAGLYAEATRRQRDAEGLAAAARSLTESLDEAEVAQRITARARTLLGARIAGLRLVALDGGSVETARSWADTEAGGDPPVPSDIGIAPLVLAGGQTVLCPDVAKDSRLTLSEEARPRIAALGIHGVLGVPLRVSGRSLGVVSVADGEGREFSRADVALLESFADQAALALENARLYREQEERTASEREARATADRFRDLVNDLDAIVWEASTNPWRVSFISERAEAILGYSLEEWLRDPELTARHVHPDDRARVMKALEAATVPLQDQVLEYRAVAADGGLHFLRTTLRVGSGGEDGGRRVRGLTVKRRRLEEQVRQGQKMEAIGTLAGGIAHDFNNILGSILGFSELALREAGPGDKARTYVSEVLKASHRARDLVQQILAFSRRQDKEHKPLDVKAVVEEVLKLIRAALPSTIEIRQDVRTTSTTIRGASSQLHQVLMNLCTNAGHAMRDRGGRLEVTLDLVHVDAELVTQEADLSEGHYVRLSITDTGCGIDRATQERIFEPFFTTKAPGEGTGLGLSVVHGIVKSHGGAIKVYSEVGLGTTFHVYLPFLGNGPVADGPVQADTPRGRGEHILLVDDEEPLTILGQAMLEGLGYQVTGLTSSRAALETFRASPERFDLVVTDLTMPQLRGTELASELRRVRADVPIILTSGHSGHDDRERAQALGIAEFLAKPTTADALGTAVHRVLAAAAR